MSLIEIQKALITDDLATAISGMSAHASETRNDRLQNQIIHQSSRYHGNERANEMGTLGAEHYNRTRNQLRHALQEIFKRFPGYSSDIVVEAQKLVEKPTDELIPQIVIDFSFKGNPSKILMLTSNPSGTGKLQLEKEHSRISQQIQNSSKANKFAIKSKHTITLSQFTEAIIDEKPAIVHFSGHGELDNTIIREAQSRGQRLDEDKSGSVNSTGIILTSEDGREPFFVGTSVIQRIFRIMVQKQKIAIKAVIFNSCYSEAQAKAIADLVPHVIGTTSTIGDEAAIAFANGFYSFLTRTNDIEVAWENGVTLAMAYGEPEERFIYFKDGEKVST